MGLTPGTSTTLWPADRCQPARDSKQNPTEVYAYYDSNLCPPSPTMQASWRRREATATPWGAGAPGSGASMTAWGGWSGPGPLLELGWPRRGARGAALYHLRCP